MLALEHVAGRDHLPIVRADISRQRSLEGASLETRLRTIDVTRLAWLSRSLGDGFPAPLEASAFRGEFFARIPGHRRSFFFHLGLEAPGAGVIAFKGAEPTSPNFEAFLRQLSEIPSGQSGLSLAEYFPLIEGKPPLALSLREAEHEFDVAAHLQDHARAPRRPMGVPVPVAVYRLSECHRRTYLASLFRVFGPTLTETVDKQTQGGLGVYAYLYPTLPIRVANQQYGLRETVSDRRLLLAVTRSKVCRLWMATLDDILTAGVVPVPCGPISAGVCVDDNNAVIDGGFVDLAGCCIQDSSQKGSEGLLRAASMLTRTMIRYLNFDLIEHANKRDLAYSVSQLCRVVAANHETAFSCGSMHLDDFVPEGY